MSTITEYLKKAGSSLQAFADLLIYGLKWPIPSGLEWDDLPIDWSPAELDLDPEKVGPIRIHQLNIVTDQQVGILVLQFDGKRLPVAAVRRIIERFLKTPGGKTRSGRRPAWEEDRVLVFAISPQDNSIHAIGVGREDGRRVLRSLSWSTGSTPARLELIAERGVPELVWGDRGPALTTGLSRTAGFGAYRGAIRSAASLAARMAEVARELREEVLDLLDVETEGGPMRTLLGEFQERLLPDLDHKKFADVYAQTMVYGLLSARVTHPELFAGDRPLLGIRFSNELLDSIYARFREQTAGELDVDELGLGELAGELAKTDIEELLADFGSKDRKMDPVVFLYEQFLQQYDSRQRMDAGAFYTPLPVVRFMTRAVDHILKTTFRLPLGIADPATWSEVCRNLGIILPDDTVPDRPFVSMVDPATGTGTYLMEWIRVARESYVAANGNDKGWSKHFEEHVAPAMHAFELMLAPYAIAHLKFAVEGHASGIEDIEPTILLSDTLQHPALGGNTGLWNEDEDDPIAVEAERADTLKTRERFTVVIGNPPYNREQGTAAGEQRGGGVVRYGSGQIKPLINDLTKPMTDAGQGVHIKNLYNDYVYFWRWATWKATQDLGDGPGIVAMITASSYLSGKSMSGLRAHLRDVFDDFYVIDLGGEGRGANTEENVFDILTPVAIGIGVRSTGTRNTSKSRNCRVHFARVSGSRADKFDWLERDFGDVEFVDVPGKHLDSLAPAASGAYADWPSLDDLMPWSHSGSQVKRTWPISQSADVLRRRWEALLSAKDRVTAMKVSRDRTLDSTPAALGSTGRLAALRSVRPGDAPESIEPYGYRSFDRQFVIADARLADYPRPELWAVRSDQQIYLTTLTSTTLGHGPVLTATPYVPDLDHFKNRGAKDVFPMWRDKEATDPNLGPVLLDRLAEALGEGISPEEIVQYLYGIGGTAAFSERFAEELAVAAGPVHLPITKDRALFGAVATLGKELLAWHTWGERYTNKPIPLGPAAEVAKITGKPERFGYDAASQTLTVGNGAIAPVSPEVWDFEVSGMKPLQKWLGYRMAKRQGRTSSPLDAITYDEWAFTDELLLVVGILQHTVDLTPRAAELLERVLAGSLFTAEELS
ncbi:type ISP restriction/modification enzyme [Microbacterium sp. UBA837]|uniref:type ISP restriction/modification enzyme n=1 Tax=Microbacterium sp. UBA837 TaxID=1946956 RepID=UPI0025D927E2|nr:type ISP restriction/modification enzyme [Microbacterium sp. UBA837]|tara:strand:- start:18578 stop:21922 length:3345 start_codon:yes stop_codon:yes gene_type:complete